MNTFTKKFGFLFILVAAVIGAVGCEEGGESLVGEIKDVEEGVQYESSVVRIESAQQDVSGWSEYRNSFGNYSVHYPKGFELYELGLGGPYLDETSRKVHFTYKGSETSYEDTNFSIEVSENEKVLFDFKSVDEVKNYIEKDGLTIENIEYVKINATEGIRFTKRQINESNGRVVSNQIVGEDIIFVHKNKVLRVEFSTFDEFEEPDKRKEERLFNVLGTMRFN